MEYKKLEDVCEILDNKRIPITASERKSGCFPYYGANGIQDYVDSYIFDDELVLLAEDGGNFGSKDKPIAYRVSGKCWVNNHAHVLKARETIDIDYLCYSLMFYDTTGIVNGATRQKLTQSAMRSMQIPIVSLEEQTEIVLKLNRISELIDKRKKQFEKLDELVKSRFIEMFGGDKYPRMQVQSLCADIVDCPHTTPKYNGVLCNPAIRTSEIKKGFISWDTMRYVSDDEYEERTARLKPEAGDIVYGREGTFGNAAVLPQGHKFCLGQRVMLLRPDYTKCTSEYLLYAVISDDVYQQALEKNNASTVAHVNVADVKRFIIPLPPINLQNKFATFVEQTDKLKFDVQQSLEKLETLKKALMQKYF
ncbi:MAG: restriction endonuclease subunit S [Clostridia bacterium]|nr:restriction endonuclease subunit S [Clostridia bacterium]